MSMRVTASQEAVGAVKTMQSVIDTVIPEAFNSLQQQANVLLDENNWAGHSADQFRHDVWPAIQTATQKFSTDLGQLRAKVDSILAGILAAGGN